MGSLVAAVAAALFTFWPQSGLIGQDLYVGNYVDLDPAAGATLDAFCGHRTYDTHTGDDITIRSFREVSIGVPVYSLTDGTVQEAVGGGFDFRYGTSTILYDNHVVVAAPDGRTFVYGHLRHDVTLRRGDTVRAGQQIGWTASSGNSSWPHLHFTELVGQGVVRDAFAGPCRPGGSDFADQPSVRDSAYARNVVVSARPFTGKAQLPWDEAVRTGTFVRGTRDVYLRLELGEFAGGDERLELVRPDGSVALEEGAVGTPDGVGQGHGQTAKDYRLRGVFDASGTWRLRYSLDGTMLVDAPLRIVAHAAQARNRPPVPVTLQLRMSGAHDPALCIVQTTLAVRDPDYDVVRYRFRWSAATKVLRAVTTAGLTDVLPRDVAQPGQTIHCDVTPSDGRLDGRKASVSGLLPR